MARFTWRDTFPGTADDKTATINGYPRAYLRVFRLVGTRPDGRAWCWTVAGDVQIASGWEADGRTAATNAIAAWEAYGTARVRRSVE